MEFNCKHNRKPQLQTYWPRSAAGKDSLALHVINLYKSQIPENTITCLRNLKPEWDKIQI